MSVSSLIPDILNKFINAIVVFIWNFKKPQFITIQIFNYTIWLNYWENTQTIILVLTRTVPVGSPTVYMAITLLLIYTSGVILTTLLCSTGPNRPRTHKEDAIVVLKIIQYTKILMARTGCGCGTGFVDNSPCALSASEWAPHWPAILLFPAQPWQISVNTNQIIFHRGLSLLKPYQDHSHS